MQTNGKLWSSAVYSCRLHPRSTWRNTNCNTQPIDRWRNSGNHAHWRPWMTFHHVDFDLDVICRTAVFRQWQIIQYRNECWTMLNTTHSTSVKQSNKSVPTTSGHQRRFLTLTLFWHRSTNPGWSVVVVTCEIKLFWNDFEIISVL